MTDLPDFIPDEPRKDVFSEAIRDVTQSYRERARRKHITDGGFGNWLTHRRHDYDWTARHFVLMQEVLDKVTAGELRRVAFSVSIRHGKTEHNSISYAAYHIERNPGFRFIVASYNQMQAEKVSRQIRKLVRACGVPLNEERNSAREWETMAGGGVRAVGSGAGVASVNADGIIIDDPIGSRDEAESQAHRDRVYDWITNDLLARCEPHTFVLFTMSRWHIDDPMGRLLDQQRAMWHLVDMPGLCEDAATDPLGRKEGEVLWPEFRNLKWMQEARIALGEYGFASLIQGRPRPREGGMFKWAWWRIIPEVPLQGRMIRYLDPAGTEQKSRSHDPDYTATTLACRMSDGRTALVDVTRFRFSVAQRDAELERIARDDVKKYLGRVTWWLEREVGIAGEDRTKDLVRRLQNCGLAVYTEHATGNKIHRVEPLASKAEVGNLVLVRGDWNDMFRTEAADFPNGLHDDMIDSAAGAVSKLDAPMSQVGFTSLRI